jgi:hypothetical protein
MKNSVGFLVSGDIKSLWKRPLRLERYQAFRTGEGLQTLRERATILRYTCSVLCMLRELKLPPRLNWILPFSGLLGGISEFKTNVSGLHIGPIFKAGKWEGEVVPKRRL